MDKYRRYKHLSCFLLFDFGSTFVEMSVPVDAYVLLSQGQYGYLTYKSDGTKVQYVRFLSESRWLKAD